ncbi:MAG: M48 family metallopeptidase [Elusimicrobiota bacterium]
MAKTIKIKNKDIQYSVSRRDVKYARLEFKTGDLLVILPKKIKNEQEIIGKHKKWIYDKYCKIEQVLGNVDSIKLNEKFLNGKFKEYINKSVEKNSTILGVEVNKILIRKMRSKWGSMSSNSNMTINSHMRLLPKRLIDYIVYHELVHLIEKKHNDSFWNIIRKKYKNYSRYENDLFKYWFLINQRVG